LIKVSRDSFWQMRMRIPQTDKDDDENFFVDEDRNSSIKQKDN
jgi:hypothetical protein